MTKMIGTTITSYIYDDNKLVEESSPSFHVEYKYEEMDDYVIPIGFVYDGNEYVYVKNEANVIVGISDGNIMIVKYLYDSNGSWLQTLGLDNGEWVDKSNEEAFIENINHLLLEGSYIDKETGWYYQYRRFFDPIAGCFVINEENILQEDDAGIEPYDMASEIRNQATALYNSLLSSSTFGTPITYSSTWYSNLREVEIMARLIYGEASSHTNQIIGVSYVLVNRKESNQFAPSTLMGVCTQASQFSTITGNSDSTNQARNPDTTSTRWKNAAYYACLLYVSQTKSVYGQVVSAPNEYNGQCYFRGKKYFEENLSNYNSTNRTGIFRGTAIKDITQLGDTNGNYFFSYQ